jgi:hypothetical protein
MRSKVATRTLTILIVPAVLAACQLGLPQQVTPDPGALTCAAWLGITDRERVALADRLVGSSGDLLERIRVRQHQPEGTPRDSLIRDVVGSLTKNCEVWPPRERPVGEVMDALY